MPDPTSFVQPCLQCVGASSGHGNFKWPKIDEPGLPRQLLGTFSGLAVGIDYVLKFIPPDPGNIPKLPQPDMFIKAFFAAPGLPSMPSFPLPGLGITVPAFSGVKLPSAKFPSVGPWPNSASIKISAAFILAPYLTIKGIVQSIIDLNLKVPDVGTIQGIIINAGKSVGFPDFPISGCLAKSFKSMLNVIPG